MSADGFAGFSVEALEFLDDLGTHDKAWFDAHRGTYDAEIAVPAKQFVVGMTGVLDDLIGPGIVGVAKVNGSISPINNDRRFAPAAASYKDHLLFRWWEGQKKSTSPTLFVRVSPSGTGFASGIAPVSVDRWRAAVDSADGAKLSEALAELHQRRSAQVAGPQLKRVPAPYAADHERAELLRYKGIQCRWSEPSPPSIHTAGYVEWCASRLAECIPIHRWFVEHLGSDTAD